ncbi:triple tyrosine motif-containing protein [Chloroflexota bacterium]
MINKYLVILLLASSLFLCCKQNAEPAPLPLPPTPSPPAQETEPVDTTEPTVEIITTPAGPAEGQEITFQWTGSDDRTPTSDITYSYFLLNHDDDYSPFASVTAITYSDLPAGTYIFYVKSKDEAGNISSHPAEVEITIAEVEKEEQEVQPPITSQLLIVTNSEVSRIAVAGYGNVIYTLDSANGRIYKSDQGGFGWRVISTRITGTPTWDAFAIAQDNPDIIAVATDAGTEVWLSVDGGANFSRTNLSGSLGGGERIKCIAISSAYGNNSHELAVGTSTGNGNGKVWINVVSMFPGGWNDISTGAAGWQPPSSTSGVDIFAVEYSPAFTGDGTILAVVASGPNANTGDTFLYAGRRDLSANTCTWNQFPGYPVEICQTGLDTPGTPLTFADLALPSDYQGSTISQRHVYACWTDDMPGNTPTGNNNDDVYRIDDTICYPLGAKPDIMCSLAHYGFYRQGKLLAGAITSKAIKCPGSQVYLTLNPQSTCPDWQHSLKPPAGYNSQVAWSPDGGIAYSGTSSIGGAAYDQSAFSRSTDNGLTWNQIGLIDT